MNRSRPNTLVADDLLHENVILCCGEDTQELLQGFREYQPLQTHEYRCYKFWKYPSFTLIWTGIGTGCLEPLLFEILEPAIIKRTILIGTAGALNDRIQTGEPHLIQYAHLGCTGITLHDRQALQPNWQRNIPSITAASIISTDYYYGFSRINSPLVDALQAADAQLKGVLSNACKEVDLVDMETAQFYHFCRVLGRDSLQCLALKGPSNPITHVEQQTLHSEQLLAKLTKTAIELFEK